MLRIAGTVENAPLPVAVRIWPATVHIPFTVEPTLVAWAGGVVANVLQVRVAVSVLGAVTAAGVCVSVKVVVPGV